MEGFIYMCVLIWLCWMVICLLFVIFVLICVLMISGKSIVEEYIVINNLMNNL